VRQRTLVWSALAFAAAWSLPVSAAPRVFKAGLVACTVPNDQGRAPRWTDARFEYIDGLLSDVAAEAPTVVETVRKLGFRICLKEFDKSDHELFLLAEV
jgi:hypothetical protein